MKPTNPAVVPRPWQPRFGILGLLLLMLVASVMAAGGYYFMQMLRGGRSQQLAFILFTVASPLLLLVLVSLIVAISRRNVRVRRKSEDGAVSLRDAGAGTRSPPAAKWASIKKPGVIRRPGSE